MLFIIIYLLGVIAAYGITLANLYKQFPESERTLKIFCLFFALGSWLSVAVTIINDGWNGFYWGTDEYYD